VDNFTVFNIKSNHYQLIVGIDLALNNRPPARIDSWNKFPIVGTFDLPFMQEVWPCLRLLVRLYQNGARSKIALKLFR
jgi:HigB_toxin, RelE-like toxic component of a toxin-antitoxin system